MRKNNDYIVPRVKVFESFEKANKESAKYGDFMPREDTETALEQYFLFPRTFVVAEPGYGKTRLLEELVTRAKLANKKAVKVDLKKLPIGIKIEEWLTSKDRPFNSDFPKLRNSKNFLVCLDALDEVTQDNFATVVEEIKSFISKYDRVLVVVACRWHFFEKYKELFINSDFRYAHIFSFSKNEVRLYLKQKSISEENITKLFNSLYSKNRNLIIQIPRYLELLVVYIKEKGIENVDALTRTDLFEYFIYKKLGIEDKNLNTQKRDLIKRVLEKLALLMEIYQTNLLTKDELMTFFDDVKSDLKTSLLQQVKLEVFYDKSLLKDNTDSIEFDNTEFQEYLAAKEIVRLGNLSQIVFDLSVDPELREIYPSWFSTLGYLVDLDITLLKPLLDFGSHGKEVRIQDEEYHRFLTRVNLNHLPVSVRRSTFEQIFTYYQTVLHWIGWDIARNLSHYFDISQLNLLKGYVNKKKYDSETQRFVQCANVSQIVGFLFERGVLSSTEQKYWEKILIKFAEDTNENGVLQRHALFALQNLNDESVIDKVTSVWDHKSELVRNNFLELVREVNPNNPTSIRFFVEGTKVRSIYARYGLHSVSSAQAIKKLLNYFTNDEIFLKYFFDQESIFKDKDKQITDNISKVWSKDVEKLLKNIVLKSFESDFWHMAENSEFIKNITLLLKEKDVNYIFKLIAQFRKSDKAKKNIFSLRNIFSAILEKHQVKKFIDQIVKVEHGKRLALWTLQQISYSRKVEGKKIYDKGRKYLSELYDQSEKSIKEQATGSTTDESTYKDFQKRLEPEPGKFNPSVFELYVHSHEAIDKLISENEKKRLVELVTGSVFSKFNPGGQKLTIKEQTNGSKTYTTHSWIHIFGNCIEVAQKLNIDVSKYREKIISYIPFAYHNQLTAIFDLIDDIKPQELKQLLKVYLEKTSDLWRNMPDSFIATAKQYRFEEALPILVEFVDQSDFSIHDRASALEAAEFLKPNSKFLKSVFKQYLKRHKKLAEKANSLLIEKHNDKEAIDWLLKQIKEGAFTFVEPKGAHSVGEQEHELHSKDFASSLMSLKSPKYQKQFLNLLGHSFKLIAKDNKYFPYAQYIWEIVNSYFDNLKETKSYECLKTLENYIQKHASEEGVNWFSGRIKELRRTYMNFIGKPKNIADCVRIYNRLKSAQYQEIANPRDLFEKVKEVVNKELKTWILGEGRKTMKQKEPEIQKQIKTQLENAFLRRNFRPNEVRFIREPQLQDDTRTDFLIFYGFIGPVIIEIKLSKSTDLTGNLSTKKSYKSLIHYMSNYKAPFGLFLVIENKEKEKAKSTWEEDFKKIKSAYEQIENVEALGITNPAGA